MPPLKALMWKRNIRVEKLDDRRSLDFITPDAADIPTFRSGGWHVSADERQFFPCSTQSS